MAQRDAAGDGQAPRALTIRPIPALHLHYGHRLLAELDRQGPIPLSVLLDEADDVEQLFKGERPHRSPLERAQQLMRFAQELGLVRHDGGELSVTTAGRAYVRAGQPDDVFATTEEQRRILRDRLRQGLLTGNGVACGVALTLAIIEEHGQLERSLAELGAELGRRGGMTGWREERTFRAQAERFVALARDAELLDAGGNPTADGLALARRLAATYPGLVRSPSTMTPPPAPIARDRRARAWIVRAGREGRYERLALSEGACLIGWSELGPLPRDVTREQLKDMIERTYDEHRSRSVASQAGQVYRFVNEIAEGDVVVLPLMSDYGHVAVGRVRGEYEHRGDGPFSGTDAQHTRAVEWLARRVPYERFDKSLVAAFGQQGTVSEIGVPRAAERILDALEGATAIHLVLKWTTRLGADTIERHLEVARARGAVWWGRVSREGATGLADRWVERLREQLAAGVPTSVFLRGATTWHARLLAITTDRAEVEEDLVPSYYEAETHHSLWVKLTDLSEIDPSEISEDYVLANGGGPVTERGLGNQTPLILRGPGPAQPAATAAEGAADPLPGPAQSEPIEPSTTGPEPSPPPQPEQAPRDFGTSAPQRSTNGLGAPGPARPLDLATLRAAAERHGLRLPAETYAHVLAVLRSDKHLVLTGPPGTAKTTLATAIAEAAEEVGMCAGHVPTTATADWTTNETIGGLRPTTSGELHFEQGHFLTAIRENRWLLIDELNRSQFDRAFGQLFTVLSGHRVVLPYHRRGGDPSVPLALVPQGADDSGDFDAIPIPASWRIVATMNVFDKTLLFDMSFALMRRFGFVEVGCPGDEVFGELIDRRANGDERAARLARELLPLRRFKDVGPAVYMDLARFLQERIALQQADDGQLLFEAFYSYLLPQFEGIHGRDGSDLHDVIAGLVGAGHRQRIHRTLTTVLGLELPDPASADPTVEQEEPEAETTDVA